jgi:DNA-binding transcriptional MerR regulator
LLESQVVLAPPGKPPLKIGEVANRSGLTVKTIRFYCEEGLIQPISRSDGGYRLFDDGVFSELALIRTLRAMEIPLPDVRQILEARRSGVCSCRDLKARIRSKAGEVGEKIAAMQSLQSELFALLNSWEACGGRAPAAPTAVLVAADG